MKTSLSTASLYIYPLKWIFAIAQRAGFDGVELVISPEVEARGGKYAQKLASQFGLEIFSVHPPMFEYPGWSHLHLSVAPYLDRAFRRWRADPRRSHAPSARCRSWRWISIH